MAKAQLFSEEITVQENLGGKVIIGSPGDPTDLSVTGKLQATEKMEVPHISLHQQYHGQKLFVFGAGTSHTIDLVSSFPGVLLTYGNGWAVFVKYCGLGTGGTIESREFTISRDSAGNWNSAAYSGNSTDTANLSSVAGNGNSITMYTNSGTYVSAEVTVMIR